MENEDSESDESDDLDSPYADFEAMYKFFEKHNIDSELAFLLSYECYESALRLRELELKSQNSDKNTEATEDPKGSEKSPLKFLDQYLLINYGRAIFNHAELRGDEASRLFTMAIEKLEMSLSIDAMNDYVFVDVGDAMVELAKIKFSTERGHISKGSKDHDIELGQEEKRRKQSLEESRNLVFSAIEKYQQAHKINKSNIVCLGNWGTQNLYYLY